MNTQKGSPRPIRLATKWIRVEAGLAPILIVLLIALGVGGYFFLESRRIDYVMQPIPVTVSSNESSTSAETTNWKTYTNTKYGYRFQYPNNYILNNGVSNIKTDGDSIPQIFVKLKEADGKYDDIFYVKIINKSPQSGDFTPDVYSNIFNTYTNLFLSSKVGENIVIPYMTKLTFTRLVDKTVGEKSAMVFRGNSFGDDIIVVNTNKYIYIFPGSGNNIYQQILSAFKFIQ